ncbi:hypothetical protein A7K94_0200845 [Modestobacter sp. VKM Ac-2676]|nr:hypothetical protein A7K94_0200845 [Modestobacter sp. VKM Ac-2676]
MAAPTQPRAAAGEDVAVAPADAAGLPAAGRGRNRPDGRRRPSALAWGVLLFLLGLIVGPVATVFYGAFQSAGPGMSGSFSLDAFLRVYASTDYLGSLFGTLGLALSVAALAVVLGGLAAWVLARTDVRGRGLLELGVIVPLFLSPFVGAIAWSMLAAPRSGMINVNLQWILGTDRVFVNVMTFPGVMFVMLLYYVPYAYLLISSALRNMDPSLEEASYMNGRGVVATALRVTLPIIRPSLAAAFFFVAVLATGVFAIPSVLGTDLGFTPLAVQVYRSTTVFPSNPPLGAAIGTMLFWFTLAGIYFYRRAIRNGSRYVTVGARGTRPRVIRLGWKKVPVTGGFLLYVLLATVLPYATLVIMALTPFAITDFREMSLGFDNFLEVASTPDVLNSFGNSLWLGLLVPTAAVLLGMAVAYVVVRERGRLSGVIDYVSTIPIAVPGIVFAAGIVWLYLRSPLYGTVGLIVIALVGVYVPHASRFASAGLIQIDKSLEEAARMSGAGKLRVIRTVTFPLVRPSLLSAWILLFVFAMREVDETVIIAGPNSRPLAVLAFSFIEAGAIRNAAVIGLLLTIVMVAGVLLARVVLRVRIDSSSL